MKIVADENIPFVKEAFGDMGEVVTCAGRSMNPELVRDARCLLVRSITQVNEQLLGSSSVEFVATATIGTDHIDQDYLAQRDIGFASAPGSNAESVAEYIVAALLHLADRMNFDLAEKTIGVVGVGNVGSRVVRNARALGMTVLQNDPPLKRQTGEDCFLPLEELFDSDILTLHVPLNKEGEDPTWHLADESFLSKLRAEAILINTSRGAVVNNLALQDALSKQRLAAAVLDVWEGEPTPNLSLLQKTALATPHIAGYSYDGKVRGTEMIYLAACKHFGLTPEWSMEQALPPSTVPKLELSTEGRSVCEVVLDAVAAVYDIDRDDRALRRITEVPPEEQGKYFDRLRKEYPVRREFERTTITLVPYSEEIAAALSGLTFRIEE